MILLELLQNVKQQFTEKSAAKKAAHKPKLSYDNETQIPIIRCSICTGEQVAGFRNLRTGAFEEVMLIQDEGDLTYFQKACGVKEVKKEY